MALGLYLGHDLHNLGSLEQFMFYKVELSAHVQLGSFFILFLTTNLPGMGCNTSNYATASTAWWIIETHIPSHHL